jgi:methyl-accepting chemotaxis protein
MNLFANMKIGRRLAFGFTIVLALSVLITAMGVWRLSDVANATRAMMHQPLTKERLISDWGRNIYVAVVRTTAVGKSTDASLTSFFAEDAAALNKSSGELRKQIEPLVSTPNEKEIWAKLGTLQKAYVAGRDEVVKLKAAGQAEEANRVLEQTFIPAANNYRKTVTEFLEMQRHALDEMAAQIEQIEQNSRTALITLAGLAVLFGIACAWMLTSSITAPLQRAVAIARRVADGDLTGEVEVTTRDETGQLLQALKDMNNNLRTIVGDVRNGTDTIATASSQIAAGNLDLSSRTEQQASALEETASSMEELTSTVKQNAENAHQANGLAAAASETATRAGAVVSQVVDTMGAINDSAKKIVDIISVIDGIAFQTNILALNAAVEAARAGEQGRGFAVVASEVRNLAQRSASAAKEIKALIGDSADKTEVGTKLVDQAGVTMDEVVKSIKRLTDIMSEIAAASREQTTGIEQVNQAISQMDQVTQQNAALVEQASAAAEAMQDQASTLAQAVSVFRLNGVQAASSVAHTARTTRVGNVRSTTAMRLR